MLRIVAGEHPLRSSSPRNIPDTLWEQMEACWHFKPGTRPDAPSVYSQLQLIQAIGDLQEHVLADN